MRELAIALPAALALVVIHAYAVSITALEEMMDCRNT
jgi:hypothetical protein